MDFLTATTKYTTSIEQTPDVLPLIVAMEQAAIDLDDNGIKAPVLAAYLSAYRNLRKAAVVDSDPLDDFLDAL